MTGVTHDRTVRILVTATGDLQELTEKVKRQGVKIDSVLDAVGVITGEILASKLEALKELPGICVELDRDVGVPPPDAPVQ